METNNQPQYQLTPAQIANTKELVIKCAINRGYSKSEAEAFYSGLVSLAQKDYSKAYKMYLSRLMS